MRSCSRILAKLGRKNLRIATGAAVLGLAAGLLALKTSGGQSSPGPTGQSGSQTQSGMGVATGAAHPAVKDALSRPITAGGFVDGATVVFTDITKQADLDKFLNRCGTPEKKTILETIGSGVALLDYDNDGWLDIYLLNGSTVDALRGKAQPPRAMLFHNNHDGTFTDVTDKAGVANERWGVGVAVGDYDNDGWPDIYVSNYGKNRLYHNNHDGTFTDVAEKAGVTLGGWSAGPTWGDYDHDGRLDLFVPGYVHYDIDHPPIAGQGRIPANFCQFRGIDVMCGPRGLPGEADHLFHNNGDGTFTDVSAKAGVSDANKYYGLASAFVDVDDDGWVDLVVANDSTPNYLYRNKHDGTFEDESYASGFALSDDGREQASMGIAIGDYQHTGRVSLFTTTFSDDYKTLYRNDGKGSFSDVTYVAGLAGPTTPFLSWGTGFLDYDNDGWLDLFIASGHVYPQVDKQDWGTTWAERPQLFRNLGGKKFEEVPPATGSGLADVIPARGAAFGDIFNDGQIDVVINNIDAHPTLLRNVLKTGNHWLELKLIGGPKSPRDAIGAKVFLVAGGVRQRGDVYSGGSYASSSDPRIHFGLGKTASVDSLEIHWPSGTVEKLANPGVDRILTVEEGKGVITRDAAK
ncbi:MAG TPA: CRTAC1 family protein [Candidatus Acidoferrum sp.]|nr:CRTAC1 family protein [Candidatus Acidoferrum sp.]